MIKKSVLASFLIFWSVLSVFAQEVGIGQWREHLPYSSTISVTEGNDRIYCATPYSLFYLNKNDNSINRMTRISGLSDMGIQKIDFSKENNTLVIAYSNTNIDLVKGNFIINMPDIINSNAITPEEKTITNILFIGKKLYLSCGFGIVVIDLKAEEVEDTWYIGPNGSHLRVYDLIYNDTSFIAATQSGIYYADINDPALAYFGSWTKDNSLLFPDAEYNLIEINAGKIFTNKYNSSYASDSIIYSDGIQWHYTDAFSHDNVNAMKSFNDILYITYTYSAKGYDANLEQIYNLWTYDVEQGPRCKEIFVEKNDKWIADERKGLVHQMDWGFDFIIPNGPQKAEVFDISASGTSVWSVPGGRNLSWGNIWEKGYVSSFVNEDWKTYSRLDYEAIDTVRDMVSIAINPKNDNQIFAGSWWRGMLEFNNSGLVNVYNEQNSSLGFNLIEGSPVIKVGGLDFDENGYLWASNSGAENALSVRIPDGTKDGKWKSFYLGSFTSGKDIGEVTVDPVGQKWLVMRTEKTIAVFNDNGTIDNTSDDQVKKLTSAQGNGAIPGNKIYSIASDNDGEVWIGTDAGVAVFYSPENIFSNYNFDAQRILIPRNDGTGLADILLEFETVTAIAVDGSNKKWIGTDRSGVFFLSDDGLEEIHHFTKDNSPLFSNNITSIAINDNGEVFFGTAKGLISYKGEATPGSTKNTDVYAYPNPVRPGYSGPIAIKGLVENASVKITDVNGSLIFSTIAEGGQAVWNGNSFGGGRAQSGVYLVFISNDDGSETQVAKILIIN
jgi:sugar lactone lactonase YvrE